MMSYHQPYAHPAYRRHDASNAERPPYPTITTQTYLPPDAYYQPAPNYPPNQLPPAHILQYLSPPIPQHRSPISSYPSSDSSTSRHSAHSYSGSPYSQTSPYMLSSAPAAKCRAVIIGINYFNQKGELPHSCRDARNLFTYLTQIKGYAKHDIILLTDDQNGVYGQPTRKNILDALSWVSENAERGEKVVVYYSGHGKVATQGKKGNGNARGGSGNGRGRGRHAAEEKDRESGLSEGETIYPVDFRSFARGMIMPEELEEKLRPAQARGVKLTVVLDTHAAVA